MGAQPVLREHSAPGRHSVSDFSSHVFGYLQRVDQRRWADTYLRGLLSTPGRKTVRHMARTLALPASAPQALQQFVTASPWNWETAQRELARLAVSALSSPAWTIGTVLLEKRGRHSVGVRQHTDLPSGRRVNCQIGIGLFLTDDRSSLPVSWRLLMDDAWCGDLERRRRARIPDRLTPLPARALALDMVTQVAGRGVPGSLPLVFGLDAAWDVTHLALQLAFQRRAFVIEVPASQPVIPVSHPDAPAPVVARPVTAEEGARTARSRYRAAGDRPLSMPVRLASRPGAPAGRQVLQLIAEPSKTEAGFHRYWVTSMRGVGAEQVRSLARRSVTTDATLRHMKDDLGLLDFEGRSFPGWHHHMTLASAAFHFRHLDRLPAPVMEVRSA
ncbi:IS701 family transposase [Streptomyces sp. NBC_00683]|uniref:IS701 family transposase n=1 Tax=Streptomyces sp. NBC_00683 TaxID=2903670 RepID=UPI003FA7AA72